MKKSHRVAHEKSEAWWVLLLSLYNFYCGCQDSSFKKIQASLQFSHEVETTLLTPAKK